MDGLPAKEQEMLDDLLDTKVSMSDYLESARDNTPPSLGSYCNSMMGKGKIFDRPRVWGWVGGFYSRYPSYDDGVHLRDIRTWLIWCAHKGKKAKHERHLP